MSTIAPPSNQAALIASAGPRFPQPIFEKILEHSSSRNALRLIVQDKFWKECASPGVLRTILSTSGAPPRVWQDAPNPKLLLHAQDRLDLMELRCARRYTLLTGIWDIDNLLISEDNRFVVGNSDGFNLFNCDVLLDLGNATRRDWDLFPLTFLPRSNTILGNASWRNFVTIDVEDFEHQDVKRLPQPDNAYSFAAYDIDHAVSHLCAIAMDGLMWDTRLSDETVTVIAPATGLQKRPTCHIIHGSEDVIYTSLGGQYGIASMATPGPSRPLPRSFDGEGLRRLVGYPKTAGQSSGRQLIMTDFSVWPPSQRSIVQESSYIRQWVHLPVPNLFVTLTAHHDGANLWRYDGSKAELAWAYKPHRGCTYSQVVSSRTGYKVGLIDSQETLEIFDVGFVPPRRLGRLRHEHKILQAEFDAAETHVMVAQDNVDIYFKRIVAALP